MNCPHCKVPLMGMTICPKCKYDTSTKDGGDKHILWLIEHEEISYEDIKNKYPKYTEAFEEKQKKVELQQQEEEYARQQEELRRQVEQQTEAERRQIIEAMGSFCTTTNDFTNALIEEYLGTVSGADFYLAGGIIGEGLMRQSEYFEVAFLRAKAKMFKNAILLGANAIVGMNTSLTNILNGNMVVVVTGTAVKIKKKEY